MMFTRIIFRASQLLQKIGLRLNERESLAVLNMRHILQEIGRIEFDVEYHPDGTWVAESKNLDGIITGGKNPSKVEETIKDAIFTYFDIPPQFVDDSMILSDNESAVVQKQVYAMQ
jgi:predicted RNase H-like HicB family nuclease